MDRVRVAGGNVTVKGYYIHLFNDALMCSQQNLVMGTFKLAKTIDLIGASISAVSIQGMNFTFSVTGAGTAEVFRCQNIEDFRIWMESIDSVITSLRSKRTDNTIAQTNSSLLPAQKNLGNRALCVYKFLSTELRLVDQITVIDTVVFKPLIEASNGGLLSFGGDGKTKGEAAVATKIQAAAVTETLQAAEIKTFLKAAASLASGLKDFVATIQSTCDRCSWSEDICMGAIFNSEQAKILLTSYKAYATGQQGCLRILKGTLFSNFYHGCESALSSYPGSFADKLENPRLVWFS